MTVFCLSGENRIGEGVSSFLFENVCLGMGVDPWVFALYLFLGFCFVVGIFFVITSRSVSPFQFWSWYSLRNCDDVSIPQ